MQRLDVADMREQIAAREERLTLRPGHTGVVAVASGDGIQALYEELGAHVVDGGPTLNPSTYELLAGIHEVRAEEVLVLPNSSNVMLAAERAAELSEKPVAGRAVHLAAGGPRGAGRARRRGGRRRERRASRRGPARRLAPVAIAPAARDDSEGRFVRGDAVGFVGDEIVAWGGAGSTLAATIAALADDAEIVTVIEGEGAPISLADVPAQVPEGVELELHRGDQPHWWWLLAAQ